MFPGANLVYCTEKSKGESQKLEFAQHFFHFYAPGALYQYSVAYKRVGMQVGRKIGRRVKAAESSVFAPRSHPAALKCGQGIAEFFADKPGVDT